MLKRDEKNTFLEKTKAAREERLQEKIRVESTIRIQACIRGWMSRNRTKAIVLERLEQTFPPLGENGQVDKVSHSALEMYKTIKYFHLFFNVRKNEPKFERILKYLVASLAHESPKYSYIGVFLQKEHSVAWIEHIKRLVSEASAILGSLSPTTPSDIKKVSFYTLVLISFTSSSTWAILKTKTFSALAPPMVQLCHNITGHLVDKGLMKQLKMVLLTGLASSTQPQIKKTSLSALVTMSCRPLQYSNFSDNQLSLFILHILSIPSIVLQMEKMCPESLASLKSQKILFHAVKLLSQDQQHKIHFNALEGSYALCLTANLIHLLCLETVETVSGELVDVVAVITRLLDSCAQYVTAKQSNLSHWHPVLGWFSVSLDKYLQATIPKVKEQLCKLWQPHCVKLLTSHLHAATANLTRPSTVKPPPPTTESIARKLMKQAIEKTRITYANTTNSFSSSSNSTHRLGDPDSTKIALVCSLYQTAIRTLSQLRLEILTGLCYGDILLKPLWLFFNSLGNNCGLKAFLDLLNATRSENLPEFQMLVLFCDTFGHLITLLDEKEFYEAAEPFSVNEYILLGVFLNQFLFRGISNGLLVNIRSTLYLSVWSLLDVLKRKEDRRSFFPPGQLLIKELKPCALLNDVSKGKKSAIMVFQTMPHTIPHKDRVVIFRDQVRDEKAALGIVDNESVQQQSTLITVHRTRMVEDGFRQLANLSSQAMKGIIRVKFVNLQGLDEAGIDQDGVFKEFLEEIIKKVFDPGLNLFCATSEERLYPSPTSYLTDNYLDLFEFVGKMIGKAVYEGIVVDVPFASFFLSQVLGYNQANLYSYFDEMASSDPELYKNLMYVKHYEGDVEDLGLTFSFDQDVLGRIVTHELTPGGRSINVTNENRISYIHMMAHYKMHKLIMHQISSFRKGFYSVVPQDWMGLFSLTEVQRLISGDNTPVDIDDLKRNTNYYGGFHENHRVIVWLWDILEKDFTDKERAAFLKFVTSCSKPPLLGFEHLEPPFSIRCVEVSDEDDVGDTVGSVLRGFLEIKKRENVNRLPTASTCFNLLKLPNYNKKTTLKQKLRYAISCNSGFELS